MPLLSIGHWMISFQKYRSMNNEPHVIPTAIWGSSESGKPIRCPEKSTLQERTKRYRLAVDTPTRFPGIYGTVSSASIGLWKSKGTSLRHYSSKYMLRQRVVLWRSTSLNGPRTHVTSMNPEKTHGSSNNFDGIFREGHVTGWSCCNQRQFVKQRRIWAAWMDLSNQPPHRWNKKYENYNPNGDCQKEKQ